MQSVINTWVQKFFYTTILLMLGVLFVSGNIIAENTINEWKTDMLCSYNAKSNMTDPLKSGCDKLNKNSDIYVYKNNAYVISKNDQLLYYSLYIIDLNYERLIDNNFIYYEYGSPTNKQIVKYKKQIFLPGKISAICASDKIFAYGVSPSDFYIYDTNDYNKILGKNFGEPVLACDIDNRENLAICVGTKLNFIDLQGNLLWSKDLGDYCKNVKIIDNNVIAVTKNKIFEFSASGSEIFSKEIDIKDIDMKKSGVAIITNDGIYIYNKNLKKISDVTANKVSVLKDSIAYITKNKFVVIDNEGNEIFSNKLQNGTYVDIDSDENYAVAITNITEPNMIIYSAREKGILFSKSSDADSKAVKISLNTEKLMFASPTEIVGYINVIAKEASSVIEASGKLLKEMKKIGATQEEINNINTTINLMTLSFNNKDYNNVLELEKGIKEKVSAAKDEYTLKAKKDCDVLFKLASEKGITITTGIKIKYDKAVEKYLTGDYIGAKADFDVVIRDTNQYIRDKALEIYDDANKKKDAIEKYGFEDENITAIANNISAIKDYVSALVLLEEVQKFNEKLDEKYTELFAEAEKAIEKAKEPELFSKADVSEAEEFVHDAKALLYDKDYDGCVRKLSEATKEANNYREIAFAKDIAIILIILGVVVIIILIILKPRTKKEE